MEKVSQLKPHISILFSILVQRRREFIKLRKKIFEIVMKHHERLIAEVRRAVRREFPAMHQEQIDGIVSLIGDVSLGVLLRVCFEEKLNLRRDFGVFIDMMVNYCRGVSGGSGG